VTIEVKSLTTDFLESHMVLNQGPSHPATHGTIRFILELDGENIINCDVEIGYLHRAFEKMTEQVTWNQVIPYTDRLNYCSAMINNVGYALAVEKLLDIIVPERCRYLRVIISELSRIMDHMVCLGALAVDVGALTNFWYFFQAREKIYELLEELCGSRLTTSYTRVGGLMADAPAGWCAMAIGALPAIASAIDDVDGLLTNNRIFIDRTRGVGPISAEDALNSGFTGPCLRATGVDYDVRRASPYLGYDEFDFEIPTDTNGDTYSRYIIRIREMRESLKITRQALDRITEGPVMADRPDVVLPSKDRVYNEMEALIRQFKIVYDGIQVPAGESYTCVEGANGELGFYIVSDGSGRPYRIRVRGPCFPILSAIPAMVDGQMLADLVASFSSINVIAGELDR